MDKTLLEPREMVRPKEVCFSESSLRTGDRTRSSYYLNGRNGKGQVQAGTGGGGLQRGGALGVAGTVPCSPSRGSP